MSEAMTKEQLLQEFAAAFERFIGIATEAEQRGVIQAGGVWGPREVVAHLAGWEAIATVRVPKIAAGMPPIEFADEERQTVFNDMINAALVTMIGDQSFDAVCGILRQAYQRDIAMMRMLDDARFQPGEYVYERAKSVIDHCQEHGEQLVPTHP
ncbi:MAG TPA: DinB family protein [Ktedonobacterales bacterium]|nr:DinB family protein [Ktedonobacterales bacterium]